MYIIVAEFWLIWGIYVQKLEGKNAFIASLPMKCGKCSFASVLEYVQIVYNQ